MPSPSVSAQCPPPSPDEPSTRTSTAIAPGRLALVLTVTALLVCSGVAAVGGSAAADAAPAESAAASDEAPLTIGVSPERPLAGQDVSFRAQAPDREILHYRWEVTSASGRTLAYQSASSPRDRDTSSDDDFGPDTPSTMNYTFQTGGTYTVEVTVNFESGGIDTFTRTVRVRHRELAARIDVDDTEVLVGEPFALSTTNTTGNVTGARLEYGGGETLFDYPRILHSSAPSIFPPETRLQVHAYERPGDYPISFTVWNATNASATARETVHVRTEDPAADDRLTARFEAEHTSPRNDTRENRTVAFDASETDGTATEYWWFFDDGRRNVTQTPETAASYRHNGSYEVRIAAVGPNATDWTSRRVVVGDPPLDDASIAVSNLPRVTPDDRVTLSVDPRPGSVETFRWRFADGTRRNRTLSETVTRRWTERGRYPVEVTMVHYDGTTTTLRRNVTVRPEQTSIDVAAGGERAVVGYPVRLQLSEWNGSLASYEWTFGDETDVAGEFGASAWHTYEEPGTYTVQVVAEGYEGRETVVNETVTVEARASGSLDLELDPSTRAPRVGYPLEIDTEASGGTPTEYVWKLPDRYDHDWKRTGSRSVVHTGHDVGNQTLVAFARDGTGVARATATIDVQQRTDDLLKVDPATPRAGENVTLSLDLPPEQVANASWEFGTNEATGRVVEGAFEQADTFYVEASFSDVAGEQHVETTTIRVEPGDTSGGDGSDGGDSGDGSDGGNDGGGTSEGDGGSSFTISAPGPVLEPQYEIQSVDAPDEVDAGETFEATIRVENRGGSGDGDLTVDLHGQAQERLDVEAGSEETDAVTTSIDAPTAGGEYDLLVQTASDERRAPISVSEADGGEGSTGNGTAEESAPSSDDRTGNRTSDGTDGSGGDATPGVGAVGALLALASAALALRRRGQA